MSETPDYYRSDPDWTAYTERHGIEIKTNPTGNLPPIDPVAGRANQDIQESKWTEEHPLESVGYQSCIQHVTVRDGYKVEIKVIWPISDDPMSSTATLPLFLVCHGGGWFQGTHTTEEAWLLWPLMTHLKLVIVSVGYRLVPEHPYPTFINDCWDVLQAVTGDSSSFSLKVQFDADRILLGGSSAGAHIAAILAQMVRDSGISTSVKGVVLNVPVTCDYRHWPAEKVNHSYRECEAALLSSAVMKQVWDIAIPEGAGGEPQASPLLGITSNLPAHYLYVAGQDPLRDEGIEYAQKLSASGTKANLRIYPGVPHTFGEIWELKAAQKFWIDLVNDFNTFL